MPVYRYRWSVLDVNRLAKSVPGALVLGVEAPNIYKDITAVSGSKDDLDEYMAQQGWAYVSTDPVTTPAVDSAVATLSQINGYEEGSLLGKRGGINFIGAGATTVDNPALDRFDITIPGGSVIASAPVTVVSTITTTSTTDVVVTSMTITPVAGTYLAFFTGAAYISTIPDGTRGVYTSIYAGGVKATGSEVFGADQNFYAKSFCNVGIATVNGAQAIDARWRVGTGTGTGTMVRTRTLSVLKIG